MVIPADAASGSSTLAITPVDDEDVEGDETIQVNAAFGSAAASSAAITLTDPVAQQPANSPPTFNDGTGPLTRSIVENSPTDTAVGAAVAATDPDGDTLAYTLTGADASSFSIDGNGQIKVGQGTSLDYETTTSYSVTVNVSDGKNATGGQYAAIDASVDVTITVAEASAQGGSGARSRSTDGVSGQREDISALRPHVRNMQVARKTYSGASSPGFTVTWVPPLERSDSGETDLVVEQYELRYKKAGTSVWTEVYKSEDSRSAELTLLEDGTRLEAGTVYHVDLRVKFSGERYTEWSFANLNGHRTNRPPTLSDDSFIADASYPWGAVGELDNLAGFFTDADGDTLTYTASYAHPGVMKASVNGTTLWTDFRNPGTTTLTYGAHDGYGGYVSRTATISSTGTVTRSVRENSAAGTTVGSPGAGDAIRRRRR